MNIRVLDNHANGCPTGHDECEHFNQPLAQNETLHFILTADVTIDGRTAYDTECKVLTVTRDATDNVEIIVNGLDYQAKAMQFACAWLQKETTTRATLATTTGTRRRHSGLSTALWLAGCFATIGAQTWAAIDGQHIALVLASAVLILVVATRA